MNLDPSCTALCILHHYVIAIACMPCPCHAPPAGASSKAKLGRELERWTILRVHVVVLVLTEL